jgi:hypothetical protein
MARGICPVQVRVEPKKQRPLTYHEELLARTPEAARAVCRFEDKDEVGVPTHPEVRKGRCLFPNGELVDDDKIPWAVLSKKRVSLFGDDEDKLFGDDEDKFESMRAQLVALRARVTTLENEKTAEHVAEQAARWARCSKAWALTARAAAFQTLSSSPSAEAAAKEARKAARHKKIEDALSSLLNDAPKKSKSLFSGMRSVMSFSRRPPRSLEPLCQPLILGHEK